ncbi:hypothetical protein C1645_831919, partial [Glomus cerebriforme]
AQFEDETPTDVWKKSGINKKFDGIDLFGITHSSVQTILQNPPKNNILHVPMLHLLKRSKKSNIEFWSRATDPSADKETLLNLYNAGLIYLKNNSSIIIDRSIKFWESFKCALDNNKHGIDGKIRILSIIAENFRYDELREKLQFSSFPFASDQVLFSPNTINSACKYARLNGPGVMAIVKLKRKIHHMSEIKEREFELFFQDKKALWTKFEETYPNEMKKTSFMIRLADCSHIKYWEDLGGLCLICNDYRFEAFQDLIAIARSTFNDKKRLDGVIKCKYHHTSHCTEYDEFFEFFNFLNIYVSSEQKVNLDQIKEKLKYYLSHQVWKVYLNTQFKLSLAQLDKNDTIIVVDYKMRILPKSARKTKEQFFGKRGWILHMILIFTKKDDEMKLDSVFGSIEKKPKWICVISNNGPYYYNSELISIIAHWYNWYQIQVRMSNNTRKKKKLKVKTIPGISKYFYWEWPIKGPLTGFIQARSLPHISSWSQFSPAVIFDLCDSSIVQLQLTLSIHTQATSTWTMPMPQLNVDVSDDVIGKKKLHYTM